MHDPLPAQDEMKGDADHEKHREHRVDFTPLMSVETEKVPASPASRRDNRADDEARCHQGAGDDKERSINDVSNRISVHMSGLSVSNAGSSVFEPIYPIGFICFSCCIRWV
jgi:hypothetical protein